MYGSHSEHGGGRSQDRDTWSASVRSWFPEHGPPSQGSELHQEPLQADQGSPLTAPVLPAAPPGLSWSQGQWPMPWHPGTHGGSRSCPKGINQCWEAPTSLQPWSPSHLRGRPPCLEPPRCNIQGKKALLSRSQAMTPAAPALSSSSPDEAIMGPPLIVPQDNAKAHQELLSGVASNLGLETEELEEPSDTLFSVLS